jgi:hypothetical protein
MVQRLRQDKTDIVRKELRDIRTLKEFAEFGFEHIRRKGYTRVITHAGPKYARLWKQILGFRDAEGKEPPSPKARALLRDPQGP